MGSKRLNTILWITSSIAGGIFAISFFWYQTKADLGNFLGWNPGIEIVLQLTMFLSAWITQGCLLTLLILKIVKRQKSKPKQAFTKANKYRSIRKLSLWLAAIPGFVLSPLLITLTLAPLLSNKTGEPSVLGSVFYSFAGITFMALLPAAITMLALLVLAIIKARQTPVDPGSATPKLYLTQIIIAGTTTALPTAAFLIIWLTDFEECQTNCFIFNHPAMVPLAVSYLALWLVQAMIWFRNRNKLTK